MADLDFKRDDDNSSGSPSKRLKVASVKQNIQFTEFGCELLFIELFQGGYELIIIQESIGQDGFINNIREDIRNGGNLSNHLNLVKVVSRCISKDNDNLLLNTRPSGKNKDYYPRCAILRMINNSTALTRHACLVELATKLNATYKPPNRALSTAFELHQKRSAAGLDKYVVGVNCDLTPPGLTPRKLSHALVSRSVVEFIKMSHSNVSTTWATDNVKLAREFFDYPYPAIAQSELGYPEHDLAATEAICD